ncbi:MAG TPA: hypothetical protein VIZ90_09935, partial [Rhizobiaceae bacterium]
SGVRQDPPFGLFCTLQSGCSVVLPQERIDPAPVQAQSSIALARRQKEDGTFRRAPRSCAGVEEIAMVAKIQNLEAAARMAMGSFEGHTIGAVSSKRGARSGLLACAVLALAVVGLAIALL